MGNLQSMISKGIADGGEDLVNRPSVTAAAQKTLIGVLDKSDSVKQITAGVKQISNGVRATGVSMAVFAICNLFIALKVLELGKKDKEKEKKKDDESKASGSDDGVLNSASSLSTCSQRNNNPIGDVGSKPTKLVNQRRQYD